MTILEFKKTHLIINPHYFNNYDLHGIFDVDISKKLGTEITDLKKHYSNRKESVITSIIINIPMSKIVYYWCGNDILVDVDNYLEQQYKTDKFNLFYNIGLSVPYQNLIDLYSVNDVVICFKYKSTRKSNIGGKSFYKNIFFFNEKIYLKTTDTKKREYKLEKLLESF